MYRKFEKFKKAKVLITGGLGFIGSNLAMRLVKYGADVTLVDSLIPEYGGNLFNISGIKDKVKVNISDLRDPHSLRYLIEGQVFLFNLAGQTSHMDSMDNPYIDLDINAKAQLFILDACRKYNSSIKIVFASTRQVYGRPEYFPVDEKHPLCPIDVNGVNKLAGEWYHILYNNVYGIKTTVLRLTNTYGPRMRVKDARQTFLGEWIRLMIQKKQFEMWDGRQLRDFNYVDDVVYALLLAAINRSSGKVFNLGGGHSISLKELADLLIEINGGGRYTIRQFPYSRKKIDIGDYYSDFTKIYKTLKWKPKISLQEGLSRTINYYRRNIKYYI